MQNAHALPTYRYAHVPRRTLLSGALLLSSTVVLAGCSSSSSSEPATPPTVEIAAPDQEEATRVPDGLLQLEDDPGLLAEIPEVLVTVTTAKAGVQVAYTRDGQADVVPAELVETQWLYMQECLAQSGVSPIVVIREGAVTPFTATDDVIFDIEGTPIASGSYRAVPILQVQEQDFDVSLSNPGFNLRSIMGRMLWLSASLPERDYPYECARQQSV